MIACLALWCAVALGGSIDEPERGLRMEFMADYGDVPIHTRIGEYDNEVTGPYGDIWEVTTEVIWSAQQEPVIVVLLSFRLMKGGDWSGLDREQRRWLRQSRRPTAIELQVDIPGSAAGTVTAPWPPGRVGPCPRPVVGVWVSYVGPVCETCECYTSSNQVQPVKLGVSRGYVRSNLGT